jgi:purine-nucleoside/S-methyl-5'-thioadenosine phosphorylase / adenosine deaminase
VRANEFPTEQFPALSATDVFRHAFIKRVPGIDVSHDKAEALRRLEAVHQRIRRSLGLGDWPLVTAEQVHGNKITTVESPVEADKYFAGTDGFITDSRGIALGVYVADCCAVYIVDPKTPAIGLVHSGRKGTELNIVGSAVRQMEARFGSSVTDLIVQLSPCIRPPHYEIDFAAEIVEQCRARGIRQIHDSGVCTACDLDQYYSYRAEKGKTGRMLAVLGLKL